MYATVSYVLTGLRPNDTTYVLVFISDALGHGMGGGVLDQHLQTRWQSLQQCLHPIKPKVEMPPLYRRCWTDSKE